MVEPKDEQLQMPPDYEGDGAPATPDGRFPHLITEDELSVLRLLACNFTKEEMLVELSISREVLMGRCRSIYEKLHVTNRWDAVYYAVQSSILKISV